MESIQSRNQFKQYIHPISYYNRTPMLRVCTGIFCAPLCSRLCTQFWAIMLSTLYAPGLISPVASTTGIGHLLYGQPRLNPLQLHVPLLFPVQCGPVNMRTFWRFRSWTSGFPGARFVVFELSGQSFQGRVTLRPAFCQG